MRTRLPLAVAAAALIATPALAAEINVGAIFALTGSAAFIGTAERDGALLRLEQAMASNYLGNGNTIKFQVNDDGSDRTQVATLMGRLTSDSSILAIYGPTTGTTAPPAAAIANDKQVPMIATSNGPTVLSAGPWSFITTQLASDTIPYIANYAVQDAKVKACGMIGIIDNENYVALQKTIEDTLVKNGQKLVFNEGIKLADSDFSSISTKVISRTDNDCLFISAPAPQAANVVIQLRQAGLRPGVKIFGHNSLASPQLIQVGGKAVEGVYLMGEFAPGGNSPEGKEFVAAFKAKYGRDPDNWNAFGYAKMTVFLDAMKRAGANPTRESFRAAFTTIKDVPVIIGSGKYSLDANRAPQFGMVVMQVKDGAFVPAPK